MAATSRTFQHVQVVKGALKSFGGSEYTTGTFKDSVNLSGPDVLLYRLLPELAGYGMCFSELRTKALIKSGFVLFVLHRLLE